MAARVEQVISEMLSRTDLDAEELAHLAKLSTENQAFLQKREGIPPPIFFEFRRNKLPITEVALQDPRLRRYIMKAVINLAVNPEIDKPHNITATNSLITDHHMRGLSVAQLMALPELELATQRGFTKAPMNLLLRGMQVLRERFTEEQLNPVQQKSTSQ